MKNQSKDRCRTFQLRVRRVVGVDIAAQLVAIQAVDVLDRAQDRVSEGRVSVRRCVQIVEDHLGDL